MFAVRILPLLASVSLTYALFPNGYNNPGLPPRPLLPVVPAPDSLASNAFRLSNLDEEHPPLNATYYFDQYIDHNVPTLGTFKQRYWVSWEFYEPGGPMILSTPGESNAEGQTDPLTIYTINGQIAQQQKGATIVIEHRFYGLSNPYPDLSVASFKYHTIDQAINDLAFFAKSVILPFPGGDKVSPAYAPWVLIGGSYAGALTAFTLRQYPDVFWAGYASSAVVQGIVDFWQYFEPVRQFMPRNCSNDVQRVIAHWDEIIDSGNETALNELKALFGMSGVVHTDDVVNELTSPLYTWQSLNLTSGGGAFYDFCDVLEVNNGISSPEYGWGLGHALAAWANYSKSKLSSCIDDCLSTYNTSQPYWTSTAVNNWVRSWSWTVCTEMGFFQVSAPYGQPTLVSRLLNATYYERKCQQMFPEAFPRPPVPNVDATNKAYGGYYLRAERLFTATGLRDPWRDATVSADGIHIESTPEQPIVESDGFHCSDLETANGLADPTVLNVQTQALGYVKEWLRNWKAPGANITSTNEF
ncbi:serine carboxypeptidase S28-domain-containing protein [Lactarius akahatsu]|uniref:Serine carboxypeptidase S28-domain-containing protein n=1 Tax=Lactarius akahatsu TaxID=416441 RepID=A0AAD4LJV1_9AGAM|nr:serine carboxypeptidase S28-domain-containing protein [Lactarius akahatsu]